VTLLGMVTEVRAVQYWNAIFPIATTVYPPNVDGIAIAPPVPVYPVIVATVGLPPVV
jgi:hypothetical protein